MPGTPAQSRRVKLLKSDSEVHDDAFLTFEEYQRLKANSPELLEKIGGGGATRTPDLGIMRPNPLIAKNFRAV